MKIEIKHPDYCKVGSPEDHWIVECSFEVDGKVVYKWLPSNLEVEKIRLAIQNCDILNKIEIKEDYREMI